MTTRSPLRVASLLVISLVLAATAQAQDAENVNLIGTWDGASSYSDIWGYSAPDGTELAIIGLGNGGISFVDVTNSASPQEVFRAPGGTTIWRDIKTYDTYAYCVDDQAGDGLIVVDLSDPLNPTEVRRRTSEFFTSHNVWIDQEYGLLFACGSGNNGGHMYIYDLTQDPSDPQFIYDFDNFYIHDLYSQDGIAYLAGIFDGQLYTADISNLPASMPVLGSVVTDDAFTHNVWTTEDGSYALTTDEVGGGHITVVDVSNPGNPFKVAEYNHPTNPQAIIHNVTVKGDLAYVAWYTNGLEVVDFSLPTAPERAGFYDEYPGGSANFDGAWGVYPYADNGYIYLSDISTGLYVLDFVPSYGSVEGFLTDAVSGSPIVGATIAIASEGAERTSGANGAYKFNLDPGSYQLDVSGYGYEPQSFNVSITAGQTSNGDQMLDRVPSASLTGVISTSDGLAPLEGALVEVIGTPLSTTAGPGGVYAFEFVPVGSYTLRAGLFGFGAAESGVLIAADEPVVRDIVLSPSFLVDALESQGGWSYSGTGSTGAWENGNPNGTAGGTVQPEDDHTPDPGVNCFFTGQSPPGSGVGDNDIDNGTQVLTSPVFDLSELNDPYVRYHRWYVNDGNGSVDDVLTIQVSDDGGSNWVTVEELASSRRFWELAEFRLEDFVTPSANVRLRIVAADEGSGSIVEAGIDDLEIYGIDETADSPDPGTLQVTSLLGAAPNPMPLSTGATIRFQLASPEAVRLDIVDVQGRRVVTLADGSFAAGAHSIAWNGRDDRGAPVPAGIYFQLFRAGDVRQSGRVVALR